MGLIRKVRPTFQDDLPFKKQKSRSHFRDRLLLILNDYTYNITKLNILKGTISLLNTQLFRDRMNVYNVRIIHDDSLIITYSIFLFKALCSGIINAACHLTSPLSRIVLIRQIPPLNPLYTNRYSCSYAVVGTKGNLYIDLIKDQ